MDSDDKNQNQQLNLDFTQLQEKSPKPSETSMTNVISLCQKKAERKRVEAHVLINEIVDLIKHYK